MTTYLDKYCQLNGQMSENGLVTTGIITVENA